MCIGSRHKCVRRCNQLADASCPARESDRAVTARCHRMRHLHSVFSTSSLQMTHNWFLGRQMSRCHRQCLTGSPLCKWFGWCDELRITHWMLHHKRHVGQFNCGLVGNYARQQAPPRTELHGAGRRQHLTTAGQKQSCSHGGSPAYIMTCGLQIEGSSVWVLVLRGF